MKTALFIINFFISYFIFKYIGWPGISAYFLGITWCNLFIWAGKRGFKN